MTTRESDETTKQYPLQPISPSQRKYWVLAQLLPESRANHLPSLMKIEGDLDVKAFREAFQAYTLRHDILRTAIVVRDGEPMQCLLPSVEMNWVEKDLRHLNPEDVEATVVREMGAVSGLPFDFSNPPFQRHVLFHTGEQTWYYGCCESHISLDMQSWGVMNEEIGILYQAIKTGQTPDLPPVEYPYSRYTRWQLEWVDSPEGIQYLEEWKTLLAGRIQPSSIPTDFSRAGRPSSDIGFAPIQISVDLLDKVKAFGFERVLPERWARASIATVISAALVVMLARQSGSPEQTIGMAYTNRDEPGQKSFHGPAVNALPVPIEANEKETFTEIARRCQQTMKRVWELQKMPLETIVERLNPERSQGHNPMFNVGLEFEVERVLTIPGLQVTWIHLLNLGSKANLNMAFQIWNDNPTGYLEFSPDLFHPERARLMVEQFLHILETAVDNPDTPLSELDLLPASETTMQLQEWCKGEDDVDAFMTLPGWVKRHARITPTATALRSRDQVMSYGELWEQAERLAVCLRSEGVQQGDVVGLYGERKVPLFVAIIAVQLAGASYLPLDPDYPLERVSWMIQDSGAKRVLVSAAHRDRLAGSKATLMELESLLSSGSAEHQAASALPSQTPDDRAYLIYTSGSTGRPKGVEVLHRGVSNLGHAQLRVFGLEAGCQVMQFASLSFDASVWEMLLAFTSGGTLCIPDRPQTLPGQEMLGFLRQNHINMVTLPPSVLSALPVVELPDLDTIVVAGEPCPARLVQTWSGGRRFFNAYGPTETTVCATVNLCRPDDPKPSIGRPLPGARILLLDEQRHLVPAGAIGELCVGGGLLARGYLNRPELSEEMFVDDPFLPGERLYRTGDLAKWRMDGRLELIGRRDNQVKIRGFRVELGEIEAELARHPRVRQAVVVPASSDEGLPDHLVAYYIVVGDGSLPSDELRRHLSATLPGHMVPSTFVPLQELPLTSNDKVDRKLLEERAKTERSSTESKVAQPLTNTEERVAAIWKEVLRVASIGPDDNFFDAGGHSLSLMKVRSKLESEFSTTLDTVVMFTYPTVAGLARYLTGRDDPDRNQHTNRGEIRQQHNASIKQQRLARLTHRKSKRNKE
ncbi:amino acid adenylation domain-containing protein [bacterium]|nr:amino acid adenylation domain-containing protein [bacterium]